MIHALQGQYLPLDSILTATSNNDRLTAAQAVLEGQATLSSLDVLAPGQNVARNPEFWELYREQVRQQQTSMPVFAEGAADSPGVVDLPVPAGRGVHALVDPVSLGGHGTLWPPDAGLERADPAS